MKKLNEHELHRLGRLYSFIDVSYRSLRDYSAQQVQAIQNGDVLLTSICDSHIRLLTISIGYCWGGIQNITLEPIPEPVAVVETTGRPN